MAARSFGTTRKLQGGWQARYWDPARGKQVCGPYLFTTRAEATRWLAQVRTEQARGRHVDPAVGKQRLDVYAQAWLDAKTGIGPRTREIYQGQLNLHILPELGHLTLASITPEAVRSWNAMLARERTPSVAAKAYVRLSQIMRQAVDDERIARSPCRIPRGGVERRVEQRFAEVPELMAILEHLDGRYHALALVAALGGLRIGELSALRRRNVDVAKQTVKVSAKRLRLASGDVIEGVPKSDAGLRTVTLPMGVMRALEAHLDQFTGAEPDAYVFTGPHGKPIDRTNFRNRHWDPAVAAAGLDGLRFHDLRHTAGTLAARTGATTKELMARLGHASPVAALIYQHATSDRDRVIADKLNDLLVPAESA